MQYNKSLCLPPPITLYNCRVDGELDFGCYYLYQRLVIICRKQKVDFTNILAARRLEYPARSTNNQVFLSNNVPTYDVNHNYSDKSHRPFQDFEPGTKGIINLQVWECKFELYK